MVIGLIVALSFVGCGGTSDASSSDSIKVVAAAADTTRAQHTMRTSFVVEGTSNGKPFSIRSEGAVDLRSGDFQQKTTASDEVLSGEARVVDGVMYTKSAIRPLAIPGGNAPVDKPWTTVSSDGTEDFSSYTPTAILNQIRAVTDAEKVGTEERRGVSTTQYRLTLNREKARAMAKPVPTEALNQTTTIEVWIDDAGRLRQLKLAGSDRHGSGTAVFEYYDFDLPVHIEAPPADQVLDLDAR